MLMKDSNRMVTSEEVDFVEKDPTGRYVRYGEVLGKGASKTVYKAFDEVDGIEVAWNQVHIDKVAKSSHELDRLYSEINLLQSLNHANIIKSCDFWVDAGKKTINIITELCTSGSLRQYRNKHKNVDIKAIKNWARQILLGLQYLHTHNPPIIHRDLKCENIFINGNTGQVKLGDFGLAIVMQQPTARSVVGTPEFMAPELYAEEYNELADIYSFGMCMLEMVTCEYPYSECKNAAQIYKKVTSGIKPASLGTVNDPQVKQFIEKCLVPASMRLSASELLKDPFLASDNTKKQFLNSTPKSVETQAPEFHSMDIDNGDKKLSGCTKKKDSNEISPLSTLEIRRRNEKNEFSLKGEQTDDKSVSFIFRITDLNGHTNKIDFTYDLLSDTAHSIACEMVEDLGLGNDDVALIAELIDCFIMKIVPDNEPSSEAYSSEASSCPTTISEKLLGFDSADECYKGSNGSAVYMDDHCCAQKKIYANSDGESDVTNDTSHNMSISSIGSLFEDQDHSDDVYLKQDMDAINLQFQQQFCDLLKLKDLATESAKKMWIQRNIYSH